MSIYVCLPLINIYIIESHHYIYGVLGSPYNLSLIISNLSSSSHIYIYIFTSPTYIYTYIYIYVCSSYHRRSVLHTYNIIYFCNLFHEVMFQNVGNIIFYLDNTYPKCIPQSYIYCSSKKKVSSTLDSLAMGVTSFSRGCIYVSFSMSRSHS